ncbi:Scr1 family TA system antitoxin-like transcriptional regulator [Micromonospora rubida]
MNPIQFLSHELRAVRQRMGMTQVEFGRAIHFSDSHVSSVETGARPPRADYCRRVDEAAGTGRLYQGLLRLVRLDSAPSWLVPWLEYEARATALRSYQPLVIPGLLQTEEYARAILATGLAPPEEQARTLELRMGRPALVFDRDSPPLTTFVIDETVLRRGPVEVLRPQWAHLLAMSGRPGILIHVVPATAGLYLGQSGAFVLASLPDGEPVGYLDDQLAGRVALEPEHVAALERTWEAVRAEALPRAQSRDLIRKLVDES